ncbi:hypothetical protein ACFV2Q_27650 [Streptomyces sp. NPDC059650]|uniref:hypothetical protein n=1 Tax=Streptomyces sp. NPDC059650 TaxID=3346896 RepID=UPI003682209B
MTMTLSPYIKAHNLSARDLARYLRENDLPGYRSERAIRELRASRAANRPASPVFRGSEQRLKTTIERQMRAEIRRRGGETAIEGSYETALVELVDRTFPERLYLLHAEGWRQYSKAYGARRASLSYLCGRDDSGTFAVRVQGTVTTVAGALAWLEPSEVTRAKAAGKRVRRQGDVYAVETSRAHDGKGVQDLPAAHEWRPQTRTLVHRPQDGRKHRPLRVTFPARFVVQRAYQMGRSGAFTNAD